jgi:superfamily II DNA or RNA helicase
VSVELRPYQRAAVEAVERAAAEGRRRALVVLPTGTGKTAVFAEVIRRRGRRALVVAHRDELLGQATARLTEAGIAKASIGRVQAGCDETAAPVVMASVATLARRSRLARLVDAQHHAGRFSTVVIDEAHHGVADSYRRVLDVLAPLGDEAAPLVLGVTATPRRKGLPAIFGEPVFERDLVDMIADGWLCDLRGRRVAIAFDTGQLRRSHGDYVEADLALALEVANAPDAVAEEWTAHGEGRPTLIFTAGVALAHETAEALRARNVSAEAIDGSTPPDHRAAVLERFRGGETTVLVNCSLLTEGVDLPHVACVVVARPTLSPLLYAQMVGRGTRLAPDKSDCLVLDVVGASAHHDLADLDTVAGAQHLGALAGLSLDDDASALGAALADRGRRERLIELFGEHGQVLASEAPLFGRQRFRWLTLPGASPTYVLPMGHKGFAVVMSEGDSTWALHRVTGDGYVTGGRRLALDAATAKAERRARDYGVAYLSRADAAWRQRAPSDAQVRLLLSLNDEVSEGAARSLTAGQVSDLIGAAKVTRHLKRVQLPEVAA